MHQEDLLLAVVVLMLAAAISVPFFRWLGLGSVIGFLTAGVVVGPWGLKITTEVETIRQFSEFGMHVPNETVVFNRLVTHAGDVASSSVTRRSTA